MPIVVGGNKQWRACWLLFTSVRNSASCCEEKLQWSAKKCKHTRCTPLFDSLDICSCV